MCVFLVCVLVSFRASVCAFRVSELLVVRLSFVVKLFDLRLCCVSWFRSFRVEFWIRVFVSCFEVEFRIRLFRFVALFDFSNFVALVDFSNFNFRFEFRIQVPWFFVSNLSSKFSMSCSIRLLEIDDFKFVVESFVALFDFSKSIVKFDFSNFECSIQVPWISNSSWSIRLLEFRFESFVALFDFSNFDSKLSSKFVLLEPNS